MSNNNDIENKKCPFRRIETQKGIVHKTRDIKFKDCLGARCPYYFEYGIYCDKARGNK